MVPGYDTGFSPEESCPAATLCFTTDRGDLKTLVTLRVRGDPGGPGWAARLDDGTRLAVRAEPGSPGGTVLTIAKPHKRLTRAKFD